MKTLRVLFLAILAALFTISPRPALAGTEYTDLATWEALGTIQTEDFQAYVVTDTPSGSYTGFTATALSGLGLEFVDFSGDMSLCDGDGGAIPQIEYVLDNPSTLFGLVPQSLSYPGQVCGYNAGSLVECISISSDAVFIGYEFVSLVDTLVFDATVVDSICTGAVYTEQDVDGDGYTSSSDDCDDGDAAVSPGAAEMGCDSIDNDCDGWTDEDDVGSSCYDDDGDGVTEDGGDCDDGDDSINPGAEEVCDDLDQDCDGVADNNATDALVWYQDADGDEYGNLGVQTYACDQPEGFVADSTDCDDQDPGVSPGTTEVEGDGVDNDCNPATPDEEPDTGDDTGDNTVADTATPEEVLIEDPITVWGTGCISSCSQAGSPVSFGWLGVILAALVRRH